MKIAKGPRPWPVWVFILVSTGLATLRSITYFSDLDKTQAMLQTWIPQVSWDLDWAIVATSAWLTIDVIPVILIGVFASRAARWFVLGMSVLIVPMTFVFARDLQMPPETVLSALIGWAIPITLAGLLFLPVCRPWFDRSETHDAIVIE